MPTFAWDSFRSKEIEVPSQVTGEPRYGKYSRNLNLWIRKRLLQLATWNWGESRKRSSPIYKCFLWIQILSTGSWYIHIRNTQGSTQSLGTSCSLSPACCPQFSSQVKNDLGRLLLVSPDSWCLFSVTPNLVPSTYFYDCRYDVGYDESFILLMPQ